MNTAKNMWWEVGFWDWVSEPSWHDTGIFSQNNF
jgi:hypothetical protein